MSVPVGMLEAWSPSSRRSWPVTCPRSPRPRPPSAWKRTCSSRRCRGDTPLHLAAAALRYDAARALLAASAPVNAVNRRGAAALHYACDPRPLSSRWDPDTQRRLVELKAIPESYKKRQVIEAGGWATMPGQTSADTRGAESCAVALTV